MERFKKRSEKLIINSTPRRSCEKVKQPSKSQLQYSSLFQKISQKYILFSLLWYFEYHSKKLSFKWKYCTHKINIEDKILHNLILLLYIKEKMTHLNHTSILIEIDDVATQPSHINFYHMDRWYESTYHQLYVYCVPQGYVKI